MKSPLEKSRQIQRCADLIKIGARPVIASHLTGVSNREAIEVYSEIFGERPPRGMLPSSRDWYFITKERTLHATSFMVLFNRLVNQKKTLDRAEMITKSYGVFTQIQPRTEMDVNRAWILTRLVASKEIVMKSCPKCSSHVIATAGTPDGLISCPVCSNIE